MTGAFVRGGQFLSVVIVMAGYLHVPPVPSRCSADDLTPVTGEPGRPLIRTVIADAAPITFMHCRPGGGRIEGNTPLVWSSDPAGPLYLFTSDGWSTCRLSCESIEDLGNWLDVVEVELPQPEEGENLAVYIEAIIPDSVGDLYGFYHIEYPICHVEDRRYRCDSRGMMSPAIGAAVSGDDGLTWKDQGIIISTGHWACDGWIGNGDFIGGNGDFSAVLDLTRTYVYFYYTNYYGGPTEQGIAVARMKWKMRDLEAPAMSVWKWYEGGWTEKGLGGRTSAVIQVEEPWDDPGYDSFWGPAVHYNSYLRAFVMLLNHTSGSAERLCWPADRESIYVSYCFDLDRPYLWTDPKPLTDVEKRHFRYPQIVGMEDGETDREAGQHMRFFLWGRSTKTLTFHAK